MPDIERFVAAYARGENQLVWTRLVADLDTPVALMLKLSAAGANSFLLESVTGGEIRGRYSIMGMEPDLIWECRDGRARINRSALKAPDRWEAVAEEPLAALRGLLAACRIDLPAELPPMAAGLFGYLGYDMIRLVERLPAANPDPIGLPDARLLRPTVVLIVDGVKGEVAVASPAWAGEGRDPRAAYAEAGARVEAAVARLGRALGPHGVPLPAPEAPAVAPPPAARSNMSPAAYRAAVERARAYIEAGDIFQVVPSQRWAMPFPLPPFALYRALRRTNPSPYMFYFNFGPFQVIGASPEILVRVKDRTVTIRPIAGTRRRGASPAEDAALEAELIADPKERAEHLMLLDLGRNDVGRVAAVGSVRPTETFVIERYSHVMHIVSNVEGTLAEGEDALSALLAGLPAGTVSGAPKIRAMEIIDELEVEKRGVYGGGVGYFSAGGDMDMCIALRTAVVKDATLYVQAGGGVVADSEPEAEYRETVSKAGALFQAARDASLFVAADEEGG